MADSTWNRWKVPAILSMLLVATALITRFVAANWAPSDTGNGPAATAPRASRASGNRSSAASAPSASMPLSGYSQPGTGTAEPRPAAAVPTQADITDCNRHASAQVGQRDKNWEVAKDAIIGGAVTAGIGAAGGAIADGGKGAGKGAAIGGIVGVAGGALYGINENRKHDDAYRAAYARCMQSRGHTS